jgi:uncharacterized membrane protein YgcG
VQSVLDPPLIADASERVRRAEEEEAVVEAPPKRLVVRTPRPLTAEVRKRVGLPAAKITPYRFGYIALLIAIIGVPMLLVGWFKATLALAIVSLGVAPAVRWYEKREIEQRERVYTHGKEIVGRVLDVEPGGPDRNGKVIRVEFQIGTTRIAASVFGSPLSRKGLEPGDDVVVYYAPEEPQHCLVVERIARKGSGKARKVVRRPEGGGGCGGGGCGGGGCGGGGGGGGGCGGGGGGGGGGCC